MMKSAFLPCGALALLSLFGCGGDKPAAGGSTPPAAPTPTPTPTPSQSSKPAADLTPSPAQAGQDAGKPQEAAKKVARPRIDYDNVKAAFGNDPSSPEIDNPSTPEKVALGKVLYHEQHLSKNGNLSCASCHELANYGVDNKPTSPGSDGKNGDRNTPTTWNAARQFRQFWDGRAATVEEQAVMPVLNPIEHGVADEAQLVSKIKEKPALVDGFKKAFPAAADPVTVDNFKLAIGAFERTLVTKSRWDEYLDGNQKALTNEELVGFDTFMKNGCNTCHMGRLLGGAMYQKLGVLKPYSGADTGRMKVTGSEADKYFFKVPTLVNIEKTAPYYHDGSMATLEAAIADMASVQQNIALKPEQVAAIATFLKATTGSLPAEYQKK